MIKLLDILREAKQVGTLYHFTPLSNLKDILSTQFLYPNDEEQISTSRRPNMSTRDFQDMKTSPIVRIALDGNKISNKYKIRPFAFGGDEEDAEDLGEEQIVVNGEKFPFVSYLKRIDIFLNKKEKANDKIIELLEKANIPYKIYQGTPFSNVPYSQPKTGDPEDINIENIPKKEIYTKEDMYFPKMKLTTIKIYDTKWDLKNNSPREYKAATSPEYPNYYIIGGFSDNKKFYKEYINSEGDKLNIKMIPIPMYNDPKWRKMWKTNVEPPFNYFREGDIFDSYILIPKNQINNIKLEGNKY
jgi:hypothetical protein